MPPWPRAGDLADGPKREKSFRSRVSFSLEPLPPTTSSGPGSFTSRGPSGSPTPILRRASVSAPSPLAPALPTSPSTTNAPLPSTAAAPAPPPTSPPPANNKTYVPVKTGAAAAAAAAAAAFRVAEPGSAEQATSAPGRKQQGPPAHALALGPEQPQRPPWPAPPHAPHEGGSAGALEGVREEQQGEEAELEAEEAEEEQVWVEDPLVSAADEVKALVATCVLQHTWATGVLDFIGE